MTKLFLSTLLSLILIESGCNNHCEPKSYLTDYAKSWVAYSDNQKLFGNGMNTDQFTYSKATDEFVESTFRGEECGDMDRLETMTFSLTSSTLPYSFNFKLWSVIPEGAPWDASFTVTASSSDLSFDLNVYSDTALIYGGAEYLNEINLNGNIFHNVYHVGPDSTGSSALADFYFTKATGIVGFQTLSGEIWSVVQ